MKSFEVNGKTFAIAKNGTLMKRVPVGPTDWGGESWVPCRDTDIVSDDLEKETLSFQKFPKIPFALMLFVREFFSAVYEVHKSEAFVYFSLNPDNASYTVIVPAMQDASAGHVKFDGCVRKYCQDCHVGQPAETVEACVACGSTNITNARIVGSAHSHGMMGAFHSATDDANELDTTGFHITFGKVNVKDYFEIAHSFVVAGRAMIDGKGTRFKDTNGFAASELIELPFPDLRHKIERWVSLVVSKPALERLKDTTTVLMKNTDLISICGDQTVYERITEALQPNDTEAVFKILPKLELVAYLASLKKTESPAQPAANTAVANTYYPRTSANESNGGYKKPYDRSQAHSTYEAKEKITKRFSFSKPLKGVKWQDLSYQIDEGGVIKKEENLSSTTGDVYVKVKNMELHPLTNAGKTPVEKAMVVNALIGSAIGVLINVFSRKALSTEVQKVGTLVDELINTLDSIIRTDATVFERKHILTKIFTTSYTQGTANSSPVKEAIFDTLRSHHIAETFVIVDSDYVGVSLAVSWCIQQALLHAMYITVADIESVEEALAMVTEFNLSILGLLEEEKEARGKKADLVTIGD